MFKFFIESFTFFFFPIKAEFAAGILFSVEPQLFLFPFLEYSMVRDLEVTAPDFLSFITSHLADQRVC